MEQARGTRTGRKEAAPTGNPALPVGRQPAARYDAMHMRMMRHRRAPGMQYQRDADLRPRCFGSAAMVASVSAATSNSQPVDHRPCWYRQGQRPAPAE